MSLIFLKKVAFSVDIFNWVFKTMVALQLRYLIGIFVLNVKHILKLKTLRCFVGNVNVLFTAAFPIRVCLPSARNL